MIELQWRDLEMAARWSFHALEVETREEEFKLSLLYGYDPFIVIDICILIIVLCCGKRILGTLTKLMAKA